MYKCPNCSGGLVFSPEKQKLVCHYCDSEFDPDIFSGMKGVNAKEHEGGFFDAQSRSKEDPLNQDDAPDGYFTATVFTCPQCGGELISTSDTAATFCSFCGSSVLLQSRVSNELKPDCIIPFKKSRDECARIYKNKMRRAIFAPSWMKTDTQIEKFRSIYMPYWIYSYKYEGRLSVGGKQSFRRGSYIHTRHYNITSKISLDYDGVSYDASSSFADALSLAVAPFDLREADSFKTAYITGHYADTKDTDSALYEMDARYDVASHAAKTLYDNNRVYRSYRAGVDDIAAKLPIAAQPAKLGFFPVWFLANRGRGDRVSYAVVNGQTGKIAADIPVSMAKYIIGSIILAIPIFLLLSFAINITLTPRMLLIGSIILGIVALIVANRQMNRVYTRENNLDDKGFLSRQDRFVNKEKVFTTRGGKSVRVTARGAVGTGKIIFFIIVAYMVLASIGMPTLPAFILPLSIVVAMARWIVRDNMPKKKAVIEPAPMKDKIKVLAKPLVGIVISVIVALWNPFMDTIGYAAAIIALLLVAWSFLDIIRQFNKMTERKLVQLLARGGDENA